MGRQQQRIGWIITPPSIQGGMDIRILLLRLQGRGLERAVIRGWIWGWEVTRVEVLGARVKCRGCLGIDLAMGWWD